MVLADSHGIPRVPCYSGYDLFFRFQLLDFHHLWCRIQLLRLYQFFFFKFQKKRLYKAQIFVTTFIFVFPLPLFTGLGCSRFARRYYGNRVCFLFLQLLRCFNSLGCLFPTYEFCWKFMRLPYSGIFGSKLVASSPKHIAGICALHRLWVPRSPP